MRFSTCVFFPSKVHTLDPDSYPKFFFEFAFKFVKLLELKFDYPLYDAAASQDNDCCRNLPAASLHDAEGSQTSLLHFAAGSRISPLHFAAWSQIFPLHDAVASQILPLHDAAGSQILQPHDAAGNQILPPHDGAGSQFGSGESSLKTLKDSLGP